MQASTHLRFLMAVGHANPKLRFCSSLIQKFFFYKWSISSQLPLSHSFSRTVLYPFANPVVMALHNFLYFFCLNYQLFVHHSSLSLWYFCYWFIQTHQVRYSLFCPLVTHASSMSHGCQFLQAFFSVIVSSSRFITPITLKSSSFLTHTDH